jgi:endonuclease V-like protein UPF0215 family
MLESRPHILGIDDAPFEKGQRAPVPIVGVVMEGATLVEGVAVNAFPVDGAEATDFLADWITTLRWLPALHAVVVGGITLAGLGIIDLAQLAERLGLPTISVTRRPTGKDELRQALAAAGLSARVPILERSPPSRRAAAGVHLTCAGTDHETARRLVLATLGKATVPEPLRIAHLIGTALVRGASQGRV